MTAYNYMLHTSISWRWRTRATRCITGEGCPVW